VVIAAGTAQRTGETRLDLVKRNAAIFEDIVPRITAHNMSGILLVATNPVDMLSHVSRKVSGFPWRRGIASATCSESTWGLIHATPTPTPSASTATARFRFGAWPTWPRWR
jgi:L-lactate dehydrogenase